MTFHLQEVKAIQDAMTPTIHSIYSHNLITKSLNLRSYAHMRTCTHLPTKRLKKRLHSVVSNIKGSWGQEVKGTKHSPQSSLERFSKSCNFSHFSLRYLFHHHWKKLQSHLIFDSKSSPFLHTDKVTNVSLKMQKILISRQNTAFAYSSVHQKWYKIID